MLCPTPYRCSGLAHGKGASRPARLLLFDREAEGPRPAETERGGGSQPTDKVEPTISAKTATPFILGEGLPPIPAKVQKGDFVDMAELLRDNIEADRQHSKGGGASTLQPLGVRLSHTNYRLPAYSNSPQ